MLSADIWKYVCVFIRHSYPQASISLLHQDAAQLNRAVARSEIP